MPKSSLLLLFGGLVVVTSFLGIPSSWKTIVFSALGVLIIVIALLLRKDIATGALCLHLTEEKQTDSYRQNGVFRGSNIENNHGNKEEEKIETQAGIQHESGKESEEENEHNQHAAKPQA